MSGICLPQGGQSVQTQNLVDITLGGNTSGTLALVSSGTVTIAGGSNITLSQSGNAFTIIGPAGGGGIILVSDVLITATNVQSTSLSIGSSNEAYTLHFLISNPLSVSQTYSIMYNGNTDGVIIRQYITQTPVLAATNSTVTVMSMNNDAGVLNFGAAASRDIHGVVDMMIHTIPLFMVYNGNDVGFVLQQQVMKQTGTGVTNLSNLVISADSASGLGSNSRLILYRKG